MDNNSLYQEAMFMAEIYGIPKLVVNDYYEAFVEFVREEVKKRVETGVIKDRIDPSIFMTVIMGEANIA